MSFFSHNNAQIYYEIHGEGDPIVLVHGFGLDSRIWKKQVKELSKTNKVITYDLRGFGRSSLPTGKYSHHDDLYALLNHLGIKEAKLVGHSFGGEVAVNFALEYPEKVRSLVLISSALGGVKADTKEWDKLQKLGREGDIEGLKNRMLENSVFKGLDNNDRELVEEIIQDYSGYHFQNIDPREYIKSYERVAELSSIPVRVIIGENDLDIQKKVAQIFEKELGIKSEIISDSGHMVILEKPKEVNDAIKEEMRK